MEKGVGFSNPVYPLVFHHKKSLISAFYYFVKMEFKIPSEKLVRTYGRGELFYSKLEGFYSKLWLVEIVAVFGLAI